MKDKSVKIILIVLTVYLAIMLIIFLPEYFRNKKDNIYILSGNFVKIKYEKGAWSRITDTSDYKLKEFSVYESSQYIGQYKLLFSNRFYLYDLDGKTVDYNGVLFAYRGSLGLKVYDVVNKLELDDDDKYNLKKVLSMIDINYTEELNLFQKADLDIDNDGDLEKVYCINNYYIDNPSDKVFSLIYVSDNDKIKILEKKIIDSSEIYDEESYEIHKILDIKEDNKMELLYTKNYYSQPEKECAVLHNLFGKYKKIKDFCD